MFPKRGAAALAVTTVALILLLSFKTPDQLVGNVNGSIEHRGSRPERHRDRARHDDRRRRTRPPRRRRRPTPTANSTTTAADATVAGPVVDTQFGPVQVQVDVSGGTITDVVALQLPSGGRSGRISNRVEPILREEALQAQSANIDTVSGATYTSDAYAQSLQAALDQAGIC